MGAFISKYVCLTSNLRRVKIQTRFLRALYASLPWFCVQLDLYAYYTQKFALKRQQNHEMAYVINRIYQAHHRHQVLQGLHFNQRSTVLAFCCRLDWPVRPHHAVSHRNDSRRERNGATRTQYPSSHWWSDDIKVRRCIPLALSR